MTKMKKALSLVLAIVMLLSVTTGMSISALAKNEIDDVVIYNITDPVVGNKPDFDYQQELESWRDEKYGGQYSD